MPLVRDMLNIVGEFHKESDLRRPLEKQFCSEKTNSLDYWTEDEFPDLHQQVKGRAPHGPAQAPAGSADLMELRAAHAASLLVLYSVKLGGMADTVAKAAADLVSTYPQLGQEIDDLIELRDRVAGAWRPTVTDNVNTVVNGIFSDTEIAFQNYFAAITYQLNLEPLAPVGAAAQILADNLAAVRKQLTALQEEVGVTGLDITPQKLADELRARRSTFMGLAANMSSQLGVWKVGQGHIDDLLSSVRSKVDLRRVNVVTKGDFNQELATWERAQAI